MRKLASVRRVSEVLPIEGADMIELAVVDGWKCVVKKGEFAVGSEVIYCEIDSFLPIRPEFEFLRKSSFKQMGESEGFRLKTMRIRGQISQGLLLPLSVVGHKIELGEDVTEELGIRKYEPPVPADLAGEVIGPFPASIAKTVEERVQNLADDWAAFHGKSFHVTEKLDGTSFTGFFDGADVGVCGRNWRYAESAENIYWRVANRLELPKRLRDMGRSLAIQGELVGPGIQKNRYKIKQQELFVFNVFDIEAFSYIEKSEAAEICERLGVSQVPFLDKREIPETIGDVLALAEGKSALNPQTEREGLVWVYGSGRDRVSFKAISNKFLTKYE